MAKITIESPAQIALKLKRLEGQSVEICKKAVYVGAGMITDQVRSNLQDVITKDYSNGDLIESLGISPIKDTGGTINAKIGFSGYDRKGVANALKARILESGSSKQDATPFLRPALNQVREQARAAMQAEVEKEIRSV